MRNWVEFWDSDHAIYVNDRHKAAHAAGIALDLARHVPRQDAAVLDYGCGEALYAEETAARCGRLILSDAAESVRGALAERTAGIDVIEVASPQDVQRLADGSLDLIVANSLLQYLSRAELDDLLDLWRAKLAPDGRLVLADVIPPGVSPMQDALALVRFGFRGGFLLPAFAGLARTALSDYGRIRKTLGFSMYTADALLAILAAHGLVGERVWPNFGHNPCRMTFTARIASI